MLTSEYTTIRGDQQGKRLTYSKHRGYHHWLCLACSKGERERIPDQADSDYCPNPGNPVLGLCPNCNHGIGLGGIRLPKRLPEAKPKASKDDGDNGSQALSYAHLEGDWGKFPKVVKFFTSKVYGQDRDDFRHDLLIEMVKVIRRYRERGKELTEFGAMRVAKYKLMVYIERKRKLTTGIDCHHCSKEQRQKCREGDLYSECPKGKPHLVRLNALVGDGDDKDELIDTLADDNAIDLADWLDAKAFLLHSPKTLIRIAYKLYSGEALTKYEQLYLDRFRKRQQKRLF